MTRPLSNLWLVRHGQVLMPKEKTFVGQSNVPLSIVGRKQMQQWQSFFAEKNIDVVLCSSLDRCQESARLLCPPSVPLVIDEGFKEIYLGAWEGQSIAHIKSNYAKEYANRGKNIHSFRPAQGESFEDLYARVHVALEEKLQIYGGKNIVLVAHAGVNRVILAKYMSLPLRYILDIPQSYGCCTLLKNI